MAVLTRYTMGLCVLALASSDLLAQGLPIRPLPVGRAVGINEEIEGIVRDMLANYREADSYQDQARVAIRRTTGRVVQTTEMPTTIAFRRPNQLQLIGGGQTISCDGQQLQIVLDGLGQYTSTKAPRALTMKDVQMGAPGAGLDDGYPELLEFLLGENIYERWLRRMKSILLDKPTTVAGQACHVIHYETVYKARVSLFIAKETSLLQLCQMDLTNAQSAGPGAQPVTQGKLEIQYQLTNARLNVAIADKQFAVRAPQGMRLVRSFQATGTEDPTQQFASETEHPHEFESPLLGNAAPRIDAKDLHGKAWKPSLTGKTTLVFFWSPAGGANSLSSLQLAQRLADQFKDRLQVVSVSGGDADESYDLLKAKQATYRTILDADSSLMQAYRIEDVPTYFLVSSAGKVRHAAVGAPGEVVDGLVKAIRESQLPDKP